MKNTGSSYQKHLCNHRNILILLGAAPTVSNHDELSASLVSRAVSSSEFGDLETLCKTVVKDKQPFERLEISKETLLKMFKVSLKCCPQSSLLVLKIESSHICCPFSEMLCFTNCFNWWEKCSLVKIWHCLVYTGLSSLLIIICTHAIWGKKHTVKSVNQDETPCVCMESIHSVSINPKCLFSSVQQIQVPHSQWEGHHSYYHSLQVRFLQEKRKILMGSFYFERICEFYLCFYSLPSSPWWFMNPF